MGVTCEGVLDSHREVKFAAVLGRYEVALRFFYEKLAGLPEDRSIWELQKRLNLEREEARLSGMEEVLGLSSDEIDVLRTISKETATAVRKSSDQPLL